MRFIAPILLLLALGACATPYGNYTKIADPDYRHMAGDAVHKLVTLYPPASTKLEISQSATDPFGKDLIEKLRTSGYALQDGGPNIGDQILAFIAPTPEVSPKNRHGNSEIPPAAQKSAAAATAGKSGNQTPGKSLSYVVDQIGDDMVRVTLTIDHDTLSRVHLVRGHHITPAGSWTRKE